MTTAAPQHTEHLVLSPLASMKIHIAIKMAGRNEVGGFLELDPADPLKVNDVHIIKQKVTGTSVVFDDDAINTLHQELELDRNLPPTATRYAWWHHHPFNSCSPSGTDVNTTKNCFGFGPFSIMFITSEAASLVSVCSRNHGLTLTKEIGVTWGWGKLHELPSFDVPQFIAKIKELVVEEAPVRYEIHHGYGQPNQSQPWRYGNQNFNSKQVKKDDVTGNVPRQVTSISEIRQIHTKTGKLTDELIEDYAQRIIAAPPVAALPHTSPALTYLFELADLWQAMDHATKLEVEIAGLAMTAAEEGKEPVFFTPDDFLIDQVTALLTLQSKNGQWLDSLNAEEVSELAHVLDIKEPLFKDRFDVLRSINQSPGIDTKEYPWTEFKFKMRHQPPAAKAINLLTQGEQPATADSSQEKSASTDQLQLLDVGPTDAT